jgi:hypothetical protein
MATIFDIILSKGEKIMFNKIIELLFDKNEVKVSNRRMTVVKGNRCKEINKAEKEETSLSAYFINNKGLNRIERNCCLRVAYLK